MKPVRSDDEIEVAGASAFESDVNAFFRLVNPVYAVAKYCLDLAFDLAENGCGEFPPRKADVTALRHPGKRFGRKPGYSFSAAVTTLTSWIM